MIQGLTTPFLYLSEVLGRTVVDQKGSRMGRVSDLIAQNAVPYPVVVGFLLRLTSRQRKVAPPPMDWFRRPRRSGPMTIDPRQLQELSLQPSEFLVRDLLLDQQIVDVQGAKVERVNDVQILQAERLWIVHVDVGFTGLLRRLGYDRAIRGLARAVGRQLKDELISWKFVQPLAETTDPGQPIRLKVDLARINDLHPGELADILEDLGKDERTMIMQTLTPEIAADALEEVEDEMQAAVISQLDPEIAADILEEMDPGEAADILTNLPEAHSEEIIAEVEAEERAQLEQLISYEDKTAAAMMTPEFVSVGPETTVAQALEEVRRQADEIEAIYYLYCLDRENKLLGVTTLRTLFRSRPEQPVREIMETRLVTVGPEESPREVAEAFLKYSFLGCPVVDTEGRMMGVILIKHAFDDLLPEFRREGRS